MLQIVQSIYKMTGEMVKLPSDEETPRKGMFRSCLCSEPTIDPPAHVPARRQNLQEYGQGQGRQAHLRRVRRGQQTGPTIVQVRSPLPYIRVLG